MTINLQKGQRISLSKEAPGLKQLMCGLGWDVATKTGGGLFSAFSGGKDFDLDASVICLDENGKLRDGKDLVYFGNLAHPSGAIVHRGDNLTGAGEGDDEIVLVDLPKIPAHISKLVFVVNIYQAVKRKQDFSQVANAFVRLVDSASGKELARYNLSGRDYLGMTSMILAEVYRHNNEWKMAAIGNGLQLNGLKEIAQQYR
ncbi:MAG: TerD family protein [Xenococcus sp. (in: cyanobacteria)]